MVPKPKFRNSLTTKLLLSVGAALLVSLGLWGYFNIHYAKQKMILDQAANMERLSNTIRLGTHYAMMLNSRDDIRQIIANIARQNEIETIRVFNKEGRIKFSNRPEEVDRQTNIKDEACYICHATDPPMTTLSTAQRIRMFSSERGYRLMGIISPVYNEPGCATGACHVHPADKQVLGAIDVAISFKEMDEEIAARQRNLIFLALLLCCGTAAVIVWINMRFVTRPVRQLVDEAKRIENGESPTRLRIEHKDEMQQLADALYQMGQSITDKTRALNQQCGEYLNLFETVPCIISVQDRDYRLIGYNHQFAETFHPRPDDYCYQAYKGRDCKCPDCPVEKTFMDGLSHSSEESAVDKDGTVKHWIVRTSPIRDADGNVVAAMELNLDITERRHLREKLTRSEKRYQDIFNAIPNPVFVLQPGALMILDCNDSVQALYGFRRDELVGTPFGRLFWEADDARELDGLTTDRLLERAKHRTKDNHARYVIIRLSASEFDGQAVLLATISDITQRLETEQQLIQASKMATLGEMATGVAHELNQPLSVIKTASSYFMRKLRNRQPIADDILLTMAEEIDSHVQRATKIIGHMRQFGRKADPNLERVQINDVLRQAFDMFSQQLKVRGIEVVWNIQADLPLVMGDSGRLEQVIINLLLNARDAIEERWHGARPESAVKQILLSTARLGDDVALWVCDTGTGIAPGLSDKIFEPFFTTKKVGQGTGLGLSISYGIIKECNGHIYVRPNAGGGACFVIKFPIPADGA